MTHKIAVIIPAYNEEKSIGKVVNDISKSIVNEVVVVSNASTDKTEENAQKAGATVLCENRKGYGYACLRGIHYLQNKAEKPDIIVFLDGDYSDFPEEIPDLIRPIFGREL